MRQRSEFDWRLLGLDFQLLRWPRSNSEGRYLDASQPTLLVRRFRDKDGVTRDIVKAELARCLASGELDLEDELLHPSTKAWMPFWKLSATKKPEGWDLLVRSHMHEIDQRKAQVRSGELPYRDFVAWRQRLLAQVHTESAPTRVNAGRSGDTVGSTSDLVPDHIRRHYSHVRELGRGGAGTVSLWKSQSTGAPVAIKVTRPEFGKFVVNELRQLETVASQHIVRVRQYGEIEGAHGRWFIVFDFVPGVTLAEYISSTVRYGQADAAAVLQILSGIAQGLADLHRAGIVHRDLKPANIILRESGAGGPPTPVLIDLGMARSGQTTGHTVLGGTPGYQSPEQEHGQPCTPASDIYCFGLIAYELATGRRLAGTRLKAMHEACPGLPPSLDALVKEQCTVDEQSERIPDGTALLEALLAAHTAEVPVSRKSNSAPAPMEETGVEDPVDALRRRTAAGDAEAMCHLGLCYLRGQGVEQNHQLAVEWFEKAAALGDAFAMRCLGFAYRDGEGVEQDHEAAVEWFEKAAALGDVSAMYNLGCAYLNGQGVAQDHEAAVEWFELARLSWTG